MERLEQHAENLAAAQRITDAPREGRLLVGRVQDNRRALRDAHRAIADAVRDGKEISPAAEWLVDNFHVVDEQLREIRDDLPPAFYRELPKLADGPLAGFPRVYGIAWNYVAHTDSHLDPEVLRRFVQAYQRVEPLTIGELWAIAITLRIVLVENLRRLADAIVQLRQVRELADEVADDLIGPDGHGGERLAASLRRIERNPLGSAFIVELVQRLRHHDPAVTPALVWVNQRLARENTSADEIVRLEHQRQSAMTVTVRNIITSMRLLSAVDWADFVEGVSLVDQALRKASQFGAMDFASRDQYRHAIEELARGSGVPELAVAKRALEMAEAARASEASRDDVERERVGDPGYYLIGGGRDALERALDYRATGRQPLMRWIRGAGAAGYVGAISIIAMLVAALPVRVEASDGAPVIELCALALCAIILASDVAIAVVNRLVTGILPPRALPRMEFRNGVPPLLRTVVVMPVLLTNERDIVADVERLEVHFLGNPDGEVRFALLSDWVDADAEHADGDDALLAVAASGIARLNRTYGAAADGERFFLLHRQRRWNPRERIWMGWERKRGKLEELNALLRGATDTSFMPGTRAPAGVRYVVTLDADTKLPIGAVNALVGTMAHPINRPCIDPVARRVVDGYGILQPRVTPPLPMHLGTLLQWISSAPPGVDPYAAAVSDVYQDLFGEGSYTGKAIYDIDAFAATLAGRVPENALLSHDLFEGTFARAGSVTDIELFEAAPGHYGVAASRQHRWARGDWQLVPWILSGPVTGIGRWKMFDNLRRTMIAPAALAALAAAWIDARLSPALWTAFTLVAVAIPMCLPAVSDLVPRRPGISKRSYLGSVGRDLARAASQWLLTVTLLANQAVLMVDAALRSLLRLYVTRRHLLEWTTAAQAASGATLRLGSFYWQMRGGVLAAASIAVAVAWFRPGAGPFALPLVTVWLASPAIARRLSLPRGMPQADPLSDEDAVALRLIARRTWQFFSRFVGTEDCALPPDNYQETPAPVIAHRTSPTNIGMYLLSTVTARDLGWLGTLDTVDRLEATCTTMSRLEMHRGHLYNWYETRDCRPLEPKYVSTVDSGNLVGCLIVIGRACRELLERPLQDASTFAGPSDAAALLRAAIGDAIAAGMSDSDAEPLLRALDAVDAATSAAPATPADWHGALDALRLATTRVVELAPALEAAAPIASRAEIHEWAIALQQSVESHMRDRDALGRPGDSAAADALVARLHQLIESCTAMVKGMDFKFLFDPLRKLFSIGFRVDLGTLDTGHYDLLASEARLTSLVAIAKGDVPMAHWFRLGRPLTPVGPDSVLMSWSGSMFEYLMPEVLMRSPVGSLVEQSCRLVVRRQIAYADELGVPWGISESGYSARDFEKTYQYSHFGIPGLGLRRGLSDELVIAPYATGLATLYDPESALANFRRIEAAGGRGLYGFYEALDYTAARLPAGAEVVVVRSYMAHHEAMLLVAIGDVLSGGGMRTRFHAEPMIQACELLLQERTPRDVAVARPDAEDVAAVLSVREPAASISRQFNTPFTASPQAHLLSNGRYAVMVTAGGSGYSRCNDIAVTRWREDPTCEGGGTVIHVRDVASGEQWRAGHDPGTAVPELYSVAFYEDRAEFMRRDGSITTTLEVLVSPEDDVEIRRVSLTNLGSRSRDLDVTSYAEVVLAPHATDLAHPAFSNLFVQTEAVPDRDCILATRRARAPGEAHYWLAHVVAVDGVTVGPVQWETDRRRFVGRGHDAATAMAAASPEPLSNTAGAVLDPVVALRRRVRLRPGHRVQLVFSTLVRPTRGEALELAAKYHDPAIYERVATMAWSQAQVQLHHLGIEADDAHLFQALASSIIFANRGTRAHPAVLARQTGAIGALWSHGISGDLPIVLVRIDESDDVGVVRSLLRAVEYWRMKRLAVDLVILNDRAPSYVQDLQSLLETLARASRTTGRTPGPDAEGNVFVLRGDQLSQVECDVLEGVARVVLSSRRGTLTEQVRRAMRPDIVPRPPDEPADRRLPPARPPAEGLEFFNGIGGFRPDGREYVIALSGDTQTPAPWINVIANPGFGFQVSESGAGYTWSRNSQANKLTPWSNDPVGDQPGEVIYVRDDESGELWGPTALPIREPEPYVVRHGQGYTHFEHHSHGIALNLHQFVPVNESVKVSRLVLTNDSGRTRRLTVTGYVEWVLGATRASSAPFVVTEVDAGTGAFFARSAWNRDFESRVAFADLAGVQSSVTGDRTEFLGRHGRLDRPLALRRGNPFSGRTGAGFDPCAALQTTVILPPGARREVVFFLGEAASRKEAGEVVVRCRGMDLDAVLAEVTTQWDEILGTVQVRTPDHAMSLMLNRWLLYQTLACRVWARAAFYQASGAFGFRDQLQDVMALLPSRPAIARDQIVRAAARQFVEGDVQHWWHPPSGRGVRTRISDDLLWLPYVVVHYLDATDDRVLLDQDIPFLDGPTLSAGQHESYFEPRMADVADSLYEHCARAIDRSMATGVHGLPLIGTGDWNDGMNLVGAGGRGESVWLGWFLATILGRWAPIAEARGDGERVVRWRQHAGALREALEREAWDGAWYRRAWFDDGTPLGSAANDECRIDSIAQSWSVISRVGDPARSRVALDSLYEHLVQRDDRIVDLLTPAFDHTVLEPGYIKGYLPGVRENGGQYTHAAAWAVIAFAELGQGDRAAELFGYLNPVSHSDSAEASERYRVEPYVVAADVYGEPPHVGRGGWTWYTGSAGWLYRAGIEWILGFKWRGERLVIDPCIPTSWPGFEITFRHRGTRHEIVVENPRRISRGVSLIEIDGHAHDTTLGVPLAVDGETHRIRVVLG